MIFLSTSLDCIVRTYKGASESCRQNDLILMKRATWLRSHNIDTIFKLTSAAIVILTQLSAQRAGGKYKYIEILFTTLKIAGSRL